ncbi:MAG: thiamine diphosphokinase [Clostridium sp.]|nr:thiamine diphosphokinase [Clostridium sp.]
MNITIISGGKPPSFDILDKYLKESNFIICSDSGANTLYKYKIVPDILLGDFDSIDKNVLGFYEKNTACTINRFKSEKDFTDTEAAVYEAIKLKPDNIFMLGCTGTRLDHTMANLSMLKRCLDNNINGYIIDDNNIIDLHDKNFKIEGKNGQTFSLQCFGSEVKGLCIKDAKYKLDHYNLKFADPRTVSNECTDKITYISFECGIVILIFAKD